MGRICYSQLTDELWFCLSFFLSDVLAHVIVVVVPSSLFESKAEKLFAIRWPRGFWTETALFITGGDDRNVRDNLSSWDH